MIERNVWKVLRVVAGAAMDGLVSVEIMRLSRVTYAEFLQAAQVCMVVGWIDAHYPDLKSVPTYKITAAGRRVLDLIERTKNDGAPPDSDPHP